MSQYKQIQNSGYIICGDCLRRSIFSWPRLATDCCFKWSYVLHGISNLLLVLTIYVLSILFVLKLRSLSGPSEIAQNEDILRMFLMACSVKTVKLSVIGLSCLQKLISHGAVASSALKEILVTLKDVSAYFLDHFLTRIILTLFVLKFQFLRMYKSNMIF